MADLDLANAIAGRPARGGGRVGGEPRPSSAVFGRGEIRPHSGDQADRDSEAAILAVVRERFPDTLPQRGIGRAPRKRRYALDRRSARRDEGFVRVASLGSTGSGRASRRRGRRRDGASPRSARPTGGERVGA